MHLQQTNLSLPNISSFVTELASQSVRLSILCILGQNTQSPANGWLRASMSSAGFEVESAYTRVLWSCRLLWRHTVWSSSPNKYLWSSCLFLAPCIWHNLFCSQCLCNSFCLCTWGEKEAIRYGCVCICKFLEQKPRAALCKSNFPPPAPLFSPLPPFSPPSVPGTSRPKSVGFRSVRCGLL